MLVKLYFFSLLFMSLHLLPWMTYGAHGGHAVRETHGPRGPHGGPYVEGWAPWESMRWVGPTGAPKAHGILACS